MLTTLPIRVLVVDDHPMVRRGLAAFLKAIEGFELVGEAANGEVAVLICGQTQPDVVLMDVVMPVGDGITATRAIRQHYPQVQVIALTSFKETELVEQALQAGAIGYLLKDVSADELAQAIRAAHMGQATLAPEATQALVAVVTRPPALGHDLTERELDVLHWIVTGLNNTQIATHLGVSPATIKSHVSHILAKLGASSRVEAVALAMRHGLVQ